MYRTDDIWCRNTGLVPKQVNFLKLFVFLEEGDEWAFDIRVDGGVPVEDDVAEEKFPEVGPATSGETMGVDGVGG